LNWNVRPPCPECERLKVRIKLAIHTSIEAQDALERLRQKNIAVNMRAAALLTAQVQSISIDDYGQHIRDAHFTPIPVSEA
jgi:hypothetical protein